MNVVERLSFKCFGVFMTTIRVMLEPATRLLIERGKSQFRLVVISTPIAEGDNVVFVWV